MVDSILANLQANKEAAKSGFTQVRTSFEFNPDDFTSCVPETKQKSPQKLVKVKKWQIKGAPGEKAKVLKLKLK